MNEQDEGAAAGVPEGLPVLDVGRHRGPEHGACVMEYASVLAGQPWSDSPACTDRALGALARRVNDDVEPQARATLAAIAPRLVGAVGPRAATDVVIAAVIRVGLECAPDDVVLARIRRRVRARILPTSGPGPGGWARVVRWGRLLIGPGLPGAYLQVVRAVSRLPRAERDAVRVRALAAATEDVRRHVAARATAPSNPATTATGGSVVRSG
jgi:hypothetical protein